MAGLSDDASVIERILEHIDRKSSDESESVGREPVEHYRSASRLAAELERVFRRHPTPFCPSAALPEPGSYVAREAAGTPLLVVRGADGRVRAFRNACRHRGTLLADGSGCEKAFVCRYHGWTYGLDGRLLHVPHAHGFPGLDESARGLVPVVAREQHGLVFVTQEEPARSEPTLDELPTLIGPTLALRGVNEQELHANWKIVAEGFLEGYHIRTTHRETFYPIQYDNLNVVERFGRNSRLAFPYRNVEKLRGVPASERRADGVLTYVYQLFPNVMFATFPHQVLLVALEPLAVDRTRLITYALGASGAAPERGEALKRSQSFLVAGTVEDNAMAHAIQRGLPSGANECFEFGRFEGAIGHFHRALDAALAEPA